MMIVLYGDWGLGIGDWGLGVWGWGQSPNPHPPIPNPHPHTPNPQPPQKTLIKISKTKYKNIIDISIIVLWYGEVHMGVGQLGIRPTPHPQFPIPQSPIPNFI